MSLSLVVSLIVAAPGLSGPSTEAELKSLAGTYVSSQEGAKISLKADSKFVFGQAKDGVQQTWPGNFKLQGKEVLLTFDGTSPFDASTVALKLEGKSLNLDGKKFTKLGKVDMTGTWVVMSNGKPNRSFKLVFEKNGNFRYVSSNAKSSGKYSLNERELLLQWTSVDGKAVKLGTMKKNIQLSDDGVWFKIDHFRYERNPK